MNGGQASIQLTEGWLKLLQKEFDQPYMQSLKAFLVEEKAAGKTVYPPGKLMFNALNSTEFDQVRVVIIGQDPYHGPDQAHGLSFSVPYGVAIPPSLLNIYKELNSDLGLAIPRHGNLQHWANQGVLLLNATLSVEAGKAGSHQKRGWETFTDRVIHLINEGRDNVVFLLWGSYAQKKGAFIDTQKHCVLKAPHPSPLSAHRGFLGCQHFSKTNQYLRSIGSEPIEWAPTESA